jgi:hypothetical protein
VEKIAKGDNKINKLQGICAMAKLCRYFNPIIIHLIYWLIIVRALVSGQCRLILLATRVNFGGPTVFLMLLFS